MADGVAHPAQHGRIDAVLRAGAEDASYAAHDCFSMGNGPLVQ
jgi:hypothetical protein